MRLAADTSDSLLTDVWLGGIFPLAQADDPSPPCDLGWGTCPGEERTPPSDGPAAERTPPGWPVSWWEDDTVLRGLPNWALVAGGTLLAGLVLTGGRRR